MKFLLFIKNNIEHFTWYINLAVQKIQTLDIILINRLIGVRGTKKFAVWTGSSVLSDSVKWNQTSTQSVWSDLPNFHES